MIFVAAILTLPPLEQVAAYKVSIGREDHPLARPKHEWSTDNEVQPSGCFQRGARRVQRYRPSLVCDDAIPATPPQA
jgi:hypothetical protein